MRRKAFVTFSLLVCVAVLSAGCTRGLTLRLMDRMLERNFAADFIGSLPDGLHVVLCGAGGPLPDPERSGPCVAVIAGGSLYLVDVGSGTARNVGTQGLGPGNVQAVLLTHFHSDHFDGLGELAFQRWTQGGWTTPLPLVGPSGVEEIAAGLDRAYAQDRNYRVAHHGPETVPPSGAGLVARAFAAPADGEAPVILEEGGLRVRAFRVAHEPVDPAVGYRFDYAGRSVVVSGDTARSDNLVHFAKGADLLVHEALSPELVGRMEAAAKAAGRPRLAKIMFDIPDYHTSPREAAAVAEAAGVRHLLFTHVVPQLPLGGLRRIFLDGTGDAFDGGITLGVDGTMVSLPSGSDAIDVSAR